MYGAGSRRPQIRRRTRLLGLTVYWSSHLLAGTASGDQRARRGVKPHRTRRRFSPRRGEQEEQGRHSQARLASRHGDRLRGGRPRRRHPRPRRLRHHPVYAPAPSPPLPPRLSGRNLLWIFGFPGRLPLSAVWFWSAVPWRVPGSSTPAARSDRARRHGLGVGRGLDLVHWFMSFPDPDALHTVRLRG